MFTTNSRRCSIVPVLVDQFNDIIEWKAQILQNELDCQTQRAQNFFNYDRRYSNELVPLQRSSTTDCSSINNGHQQENEEIQEKQLDLPKKPRIIKFKRSKTQKCFSKKFNHIRNVAIINTINEEECDGNQAQNKSESSLEMTMNPKVDLEELIVNFSTSQLEQKPSIKIKGDIPPIEIKEEQIILAAEQKIIKEENTEKVMSESKPIEKPEPERRKSMTRHNVLLEKLSNVYRHQFEVKTTVFQQNDLTNKWKKDDRISTYCFCGKAFNFSEKYLRCLICLTPCHTNCGSLLPRPCIRYVDSFMRPSKLVSNYVYPRSKPSIPSLIINCCREIEVKCQQQPILPHSATSSLSVSSFELYYIQSEMLKPVKDQCKKLLQQAKHGYQPLNQLNLDYLCGMVKYFLADIIEPLFPKNSWKEYSFNIQKRSDEELKRNLLETFDQLNPTNLHTLCFLLIHLKHLNRCGFQDLDILADIFCPILMGELECKRKLRLIKLMFELEDNVLVSYVES